MKTLYLDCGMGIAGDMLMGALYECLPDKQVFWDKWNQLGIEGIELIPESAKKCGVTCTHMKVLVHGEEEESLDVLEHHHGGEHHHEEHGHGDHHHHHEDYHHHHDEGHEHPEMSHLPENPVIPEKIRDGGELIRGNVRNNDNFDQGSHHVFEVETGNHDHSHDHHEHDHHAHGHHEHDHHSHDHHEHDHHEHAHGHHHSHTSMAKITDIVNHFALDEKLKKQVLSVYQAIAAAESKVHGVSVDEIHFHEVGNLDAIADIVGNIMLLDLLKVDRVIASPINVGFGKVRCAHGILPVPAPATAEILKDIPIYAGRFEGEMCTPTGAALYKTIVMETAQMPAMKMESMGYGCGKKDFEAANVVRAIIGITEDQEDTDSIMELACNIDDMTAEDIALAEELLLLNGALDVFTTSIQMKKNRPGTLLTVLCKEEQKAKMGQLIFKHTTTIGIREYRCNRMTLQRNFRDIETPYGKMQCKDVSGYGVSRSKIEFDDLKQAVEKYERSIREIRAELEKYL